MQDVEKLLEQIKSIENLSSIRAVYDSSDFEKVRELSESHTVKIMREMQESPIVRMVREVQESPAIRMMREMESPFIKAAQQLQSSTALEQLYTFKRSSVFETLKSTHSSSLLHSFNQLSDQINAGYGAVTFAEAYDYLTKEYGYLEDDEVLEELADDISERVVSSPNDILSIEFYLNVILALVLFMLAENSSKNSEDNIMKRISQLENVVTEQFTVPILSKDDSFLIPDRDLNLRTGPSTKHAVISVLTPNQKTRELERERDWVRVEYFDYERNENVSGWAHSKFLLLYKHKQIDTLGVNEAII